MGAAVVQLPGAASRDFYRRTNGGHLGNSIPGKSAGPRATVDMRVCVVLEHRFSQTPDAAVWTDGVFARSFWERYLAVFDQVRVVARVRQVERPPAGGYRADRGRRRICSGAVFSRPLVLLGPSTARAARAPAGRGGPRRSGPSRSFAPGRDCLAQAPARVAAVWRGSRRRPV